MLLANKEICITNKGFQSDFELVDEGLDLRIGRWIDLVRDGLTLLDHILVPLLELYVTRVEEVRADQDADSSALSGFVPDGEEIYTAGWIGTRGRRVRDCCGSSATRSDCDLSSA